MKAIKYLFIGALMLVFSVPAVAQDEDQATINAITKVIKENRGGFDAIKDQVKDVYKKNKKNPKVLTAIGVAFKEVKDTANAREYANLALKVAKNHYAPARILLGDIEAIADNAGPAASQYQMAIDDDPKNPEGYFKYASVYRKVSPRLAVAKLDELAKQRPDIAVNAMKARFWFDDKEFDKAIEAYKMDPLAKLDRGDLTNFATAHYFTGKHADGLPIIEEGIKRFPRHAPFNRLGMFFNYELGNHEKALDFANRLFTASDSLKASWMDHFYHGLCLQGARNDYDGAIDKFKTALGMEVPANNRISLIQSIYQAYSAKGDFDNAIKFYNDYLTAKGNPTANDYNSLARMYTKHAEEVPAAEKEQWLMKADATYGEAIAKFPANAEYLNILRARLNAGIDADMTRGLAKPYYEAAANILAAKADRSDAETTRLVECYRYLGWYYNEKSDKATCQSYWRKVKELDPTNTEADQFLQ